MPGEIHVANIKVTGCESFVEDKVLYLTGTLLDYFQLSKPLKVVEANWENGHYSLSVGQYSRSGIKTCDQLVGRTLLYKVR